MELVRRAYEMAQEYPEEIRYGAIIRILDTLLSFGVVDKVFQIAKQTFKKIEGDAPENILERVNLLVRIARAQDMQGEKASGKSSETIDKAFSLLEEKKEDFPAEYLSFSTGVLTPLLISKKKEHKAIERLEKVVNFAQKMEQKDRRLDLLSAEALATLADLKVNEDRDASLHYYDAAYEIYEGYKGTGEKKGEIAVNKSDIYLREGDPKRALDIISKVRNEIETRRVKMALLQNKVEALESLGREKEAEETRAKLQNIKAEIQRRTGREFGEF